MHRGHHKVFEALDERRAKSKKAVTTFDPHPSVVLNPERKRTDYLTPLSDKLEMIEHTTWIIVLLLIFLHDLRV